MANQIIIDIGAVANDGTGDPLRTAFGYVNDNFSNIWATGVANSNISFSGNKILTTNTNGNLVLAPNGIGKVQSNVDIVPNADNTLSLGSLTNKWNTVYTQNLDVGGNTTFTNLTVEGNLTVDGDIIQIGNLVTDAKTIQLSNTATTTTAANGSGITVGASDDIATLLYNSTGNVWTTNIGLTATGNITGTYFIGNGSQLTGLSTYGNANVAAYLPTYTGNLSADNVSAGNVFIAQDIFGTTGSFSGSTTGDNSIYAGVPLFTDLGTDVVAQFSGNVNAYTQFNFQNGNSGVQASGDYVITADNGTDSTHFINLGMTSSTWDGTQPNSLGNRLGPNDGYLYVQDGDMVIGTSNGTIETWKFGQDGNLTVPGNIIPDTSNAYSLGNATNQWSDLYVSNSTIYMNNIPISLTAGNVLTVNGADVVTNSANGEANIGNLEIIGATISIASGAPDTDLYLSPSGESWGFLQLPTNDTANVTNTRLHNDAGNVEIGAGDFSNGGNSYEWEFDKTGNLNLPNGGDINFNAGGIVQEVDEDFTILVQDADDDGFSVYLNVDDGAGTVLSQYQQQRDQFELGFPSTSKYFQFNNDGTAVYPGNINGSYGESMSIQIPGASASSSVSLRTIDNTDTLRSNITVDISNVTISTGTATYNWLFDNTGNLSIPGAILSEDNIIIDNRESGVIADISIYSADNILLQGADRTNPGEPEGGDINIYGGNGATDNGTGGTGGGDIQIEGGLGGTANTSSGGFGGTVDINGGNGGEGSAGARAGGGGSVSITAGDGGADNGGGGYTGGGVFITAGDSTDSASDRGSIVLASGAGGDETTVGGYVQISIPASGTNPGGQWTFTGTGLTLEPPPNGEIFSPNTGNLTVGTVGNTIVRNIGGVTTYDWVFSDAGDLILPGGNTEIYVANAVGNVAGNSISITGGDADQTAYYATPGGNVNISGGLGATNDGGGGGQGGFVNITSGASADPAGVAGNVTINAGSSTWTFDNTGNLTIPGNIIGTVAQATLANTVAVSSVLLNQEYVPALLVANTGNLGIKAADGTANITYNPSLNRLTVENIDANTVSLGNASTITTADYAIGYRDIPQVSFTGNATIATTDAGKHFYSTQSTDYILTIANNASQGFQVGAAITIVNQGTGNITVAQGSGVALYLAGNATSGNRSVATFGMATLLKVSTDTWFINGTGVS